MIKVPSFIVGRHRECFIKWNLEKPYVWDLREISLNKKFNNGTVVGPKSLGCSKLYVHNTKYNHKI